MERLEFMNEYRVSVDITMSEHISILAKSEEDARKQVEEAIKQNPYDFTSNFVCYVSHNVTDVKEV